MEDINPNCFIETLDFCIRSSRLDDAEELLQYFDKIETSFQIFALRHLMKASPEVAFRLLGFLYKNEKLPVDFRENIREQQYSVRIYDPKP